MASKKLFSNVSKNNVKKADCLNEAGGKAYSKEDKAALAQYAMTGCFNNTYYVSDKDQLNSVISLSKKVDTEFLAKLAVFSRQKGLMKDMPALLTTLVAKRDSNLLAKIFPKVINNPKMMRNFVQMIRSNVSERKSLGTRPKKLLQSYLESLTDEQLFKANVGNNPSLQDVIKLCHPKPSNINRNALYAYLLGKEYNKENLLQLALDYESFKKDLSQNIPNVPFEMLTSLNLSKEHWKNIALNATWNQLKKNLNTFQRHGVFEDQYLVNQLSEKLSDPDQIKRAKVFPYELFSAYLNINSDIPIKLNLALQKAAEYACLNIPEIKGKVYVMLDVSGSMSNPVTGYRQGATSKVRCVDVAALFASSLLRRNPETNVIPFSTIVHKTKINPMDSIMTNAKILSKFCGGGTACSVPLAVLNESKTKGDVIIYISDNESWVDSNEYCNSTTTMSEWNKFKVRNPKAKLINIDITPNKTTQVYSRKDILNIGSFSDTVFEVIPQFIEFGNDADLWIKTIESIEL